MSEKTDDTAVASHVQQHQDVPTESNPLPSTSQPTSAARNATETDDINLQLCELQIKGNEHPIDWQYVPQEMGYCICKQGMHGEMIVCEGSNCPIEWFHCTCMGITKTPTGKWYCPQCSAAL